MQIKGEREGKRDKKIERERRRRGMQKRRRGKRNKEKRSRLIRYGISISITQTSQILSCFSKTAYHFCLLLNTNDDIFIYFRSICFFFYVQDLFYKAFGFPEKALQGELALVTGGGGGLGRLLALRLSKLGVDIVIWDINQEGMLLKFFIQCAYKPFEIGTLNRLWFVS